MNNKPLSKEEILDKFDMEYHMGGYSEDDIMSAMDEYSKQEAVNFFIWYGVKMMGLLHYVLDIRATITSQELEEKIIEHEGKSVAELYDLFLESKTREKEK